MHRTRKYYILAGLGALTMVTLSLPLLHTNPYTALFLCNSTAGLFLMAGYQLGARSQKETYESLNLRKLFKSRSDDEISKNNR